MRSFDPLLIYGATGYTGRLLAHAAVARGLRPVLSGRDAAKLVAVAEPLGLVHRAAALDDTAALDAAFDGIAVVLNAAGPFSATARAVVDACLRRAAHYLDVCGEIAVIEALAARHAEAKARGVMMMPATGFEVVTSDCLAAHVAARLPDATRLALAFTTLPFASRGSARTIVENTTVVVRRGGTIVPVVPGALRREFEFGTGAHGAINVTWGDVATAYYTTGIGDVEVYFQDSPSLRGMLGTSRVFGPLLASAASQTVLKAWADLLPEGPTEAQRAAHRMAIVAEATNAAGDRASARLHAPEPYAFTASSAPAVALRVLGGDVEPGFQTPARVYGADFVLGFDGVVREDLA